jgi:hypothetical protein
VTPRFCCELRARISSSIILATTFVREPSVWLHDVLFWRGRRQRSENEQVKLFYVSQFPGHSGGCAHNPPYSAPNASMLPGGDVHDQYLVLNNQLFPLQTTLVHHHHGVGSYHDPSSYHQPEQVNGGYPIGRADPAGSLVGGLY